MSEIVGEYESGFMEIVVEIDFIEIVIKLVIGLKIFDFLLWNHFYVMFELTRMKTQQNEADLCLSIVSGVLSNAFHKWRQCLEGCRHFNMERQDNAIDNFTKKLDYIWLKDSSFCI